MKKSGSNSTNWREDPMEHLNLHGLPLIPLTILVLITIQIAHIRTLTATGLVQ